MPEFQAAKTPFKGVAIGLMLALAGCVSAPEDGQTSAPLPGLSLVPGPSGLMVAGSGGRDISFGRDREGATQSAARVTGEAPRAFSCSEPGRDAVALGSLLMVFESGAFVGTVDIEESFGRACTGVT